MATLKRVSPLKPGLRGARNWVTAQVRAASYSRKGAWRLALGVFFMFCVIAFMGLWLGGFLPDAKRSGQDFVKNRLVAMGFVVNRVDVMGEGRLSEPAVRQVLGVNQGDYLFELDLKTAQARVENISWVERAIVRRLWPDPIVVQIIERKPYALWQSDGDLHLIDRDGIAIQKASAENWPGMPLIVGEDAPDLYFEAEQTIRQYGVLDGRVSTLIHHNTGRWDLILDDGAIKIKLPAGDFEPALRSLSKLHGQTRVLDRAISEIDLRLPDRITFSPNPSKPS